jgi:hypothetical protein
MRTAKLFAAFAAFAAATLVLTGCANKKEPAEKAVAQVESSLAEIRADGEKYAADEFKDVNDSVGNLKSNLARHDYGAVVMGARSVNSAIVSLKETIAQRKVEADQMLEAATSEWNDLSASVPPMVDALQKRVDQLAKTRKYPGGLDKAGFDAAKTDFENLKNEWTAASAQFTEGKVAEALRKARVIKAQGDELMQKLEAKLS